MGLEGSRKSLGNGVQELGLGIQACAEGERPEAVGGAKGSVCYNLGLPRWH